MDLLKEKPYDQIFKQPFIELVLKEVRFKDTK